MWGWCKTVLQITIDAWSRLTRRITIVTYCVSLPDYNTTFSKHLITSDSTCELLSSHKWVSLWGPKDCHMNLVFDVTRTRSHYTWVVGCRMNTLFTYWTVSLLSQSHLMSPWLPAFVYLSVKLSGSGFNKSICLTQVI